MNIAMLSILLASSAAGVMDDLPLIVAPFDPDAPPRPMGILRVACPRCHAEIGKDCDAATLGRHSFHKARIDAAKGAT